MDRFRANLVFAPSSATGTETLSLAWIEDHVRVWRIGNTVFRHMAPCIRCLQPTVNQVTGEADFLKYGARVAQPSAALREYHPGSAKRSITGFAPIALGGAGGGLAPQFGALLTHGVHMSESEAATNGGGDAWGCINLGDDITILEYHQLSWHQRLFGL